MFKKAIFILVISFIFGALFTALAEADPWTALRETVVHLPTGSGSIIKAPSGTKYVLSNWHVCYTAARGLAVIPYFAADGSSIDGGVVISDPTYDLCLLTVPQGYPALAVAPVSPIKGQTLYSRGYPGHYLKETQGEWKWRELEEMDMSDEFKRGECPKPFSHTSRGTCTMTYDYGVTSLYSEPGSSGSPVVNSAGQLVGVIQSYEGEATPRSAGVLLLSNIKAFLKGH